MSALVARSRRSELDSRGPGPLAERARSLQIDLQDLGERSGALGGGFRFDPEAVEDVTDAE